MKPKIHLMTTSSWEHDGQLSKSDQLIWDEIVKQGVAGICFSPKDASVFFKNDICKIVVAGDELQSDGILLVRLMRGAPERAYEIARVYESLGGRVSDPVSTLAYSSGKLLPYINRRSNISYIPSYFFNASINPLARLLEVVSYPFIIKPQGGFQGQGVSLINTPEEYTQYLTTVKDDSLIAQNYLDIESEFRVTVIGAKAIGVIRKHRAISSTDTFAADLDTDECVTDEEVSHFAVRAAELGGGDIYGADVARSRSGSLYLIENNRCPDIVSFSEATNINVAEKIVTFLSS
jgi:glutathione synthase/RimK-type ligase-like ATP-grasp enzyme